jgi:hypothetical protein
VSQAQPTPPPEGADAAIQRLIDGLGPEETAQALATLLNRAAARLHTLARSESSARKEQPDWPRWAQLQNASRSLVLQASTCRDLATRLSTPRA